VPVGLGTAGYAAWRDGLAGRGQPVRPRAGGKVAVGRPPREDIPGRVAGMTVMAVLAVVAALVVQPQLARGAIQPAKPPCPRSNRPMHVL
jgi:hypothetical protein